MGTVDSPLTGSCAIGTRTGRPAVLVPPSIGWRGAGTRGGCAARPPGPRPGPPSGVPRVNQRVPVSSSAGCTGGAGRRSGAGGVGPAVVARARPDPRTIVMPLPVTGPMAGPGPTVGRTGVNGTDAAGGAAVGPAERPAAPGRDRRAPAPTSVPSVVPSVCSAKAAAVAGDVAPGN